MRLAKIILLTGLCLMIQTSIAQFSAESVLKEGEWYKIGITESGVYRLDQAFLNSIGLNTSGIDPRNIRLYGNGGGMLPQQNRLPRHDDLVENAIVIEGEGDGNFGSGDFLLFYGEGPHVWNYSTENQRFEHSYNLYSDTSFYFLTVGATPGKRIEDRPVAANPTYTPSMGRAFHFHEWDRENPIHSGRHWLGEKFDLIRERTFSFYMPDVLSTGEARLHTRLIARSDQVTSFAVKARNTQLGTVSINLSSVANSESTYYKSKYASYSIQPSDVEGDSLRITYTYNKAGSSRSEGWLDWVEIDYDQAFDAAQRNQFRFSVVEGVDAAAVASISVANATADYRVWDITDPVAITGQAYSLNGSNMDFAFPADEIRQFMAVKGDYLSPISADKIANQNLHGLELSDYLIITHPDFREAADLLAAFHESHYGRTVEIVYPYQIYNEFSSGKQDVTAIRDFIRMFYERSGGALPGYVLMMGDGTYDFKNHNNWSTFTNFVPTYQSRDSWDPTDSYTSDDYFVMLDSSEGFWGENSGIDGDNFYQVNKLDAAIGRLPVESLDEALAAVDKIKNYVTDPAGIGSWRNQILLVADYRENEAIHMIQADGYTNQIINADGCFNIDKVYMDNYPMLRTADGARFPEGRQALINGLDEGYLIVNYTGHGGEAAWSNARILQLPDIQGMTNFNRLPVVVTATCEFGRYDNPDRRSGAEIMVSKEQGGAIALFTTVRLVYSSPNATLNANFYKEVFKYDTDNQRMPTFGEIMYRTKNRTFTASTLANINSRNFTLLGDPGLIMAYPGLQAVITEMNGNPVGTGGQDTLRSLSKVVVKGQVQDANGNVFSDYNGDLAITVFDKPSKFTTREANWSFLWRKNRIFNGTATVVDGEFTFEFVVPIDVSYEDGDGRISLYFSNESLDGAGCYTDFAIGGTDANAPTDNTGPEIQLYINDSTWQDGGTVGPEPFLYAVVSDENGINTVESGIGHEIIGILDNDERDILILNDFYEAEPNNYQKGTVSYQLKDLEFGEHELRVRVWDVANNASEATTRFIVSEDAFMALGQILNVPNPVTESTSFWIGHNQPGREFAVSVDIFTLDGRQIASMEDTFFAEGNTYKGLSWDGKSGEGNPIGNGLYVYRVVLTDIETGNTLNHIEKLVLLR